MRYITVMVFAILYSAGLVQACDTPVYRYAMYKWEPRPYELYYFHSGSPDADATAVMEAVRAAIELRAPATNLTLDDVDLSIENALERIPRDVKEAWNERPDQDTPTFMLVSPSGAQVFAGSLTAADVPSLLDSPVRQQTAKQLEEGNAGVLLLLTGPDKDENARAEKEVQTLVKRIADGEVELYVSPTRGAPVDAAPQKEVTHKIGFVKVDRDAPQENWLLQMLLAIEDDLHEFDEPMVFAIFGRNRALPPYIGKGITADNLLDCVAFVSGACSCTVRDQNPGTDLLSRYDWDLAAERLAKQFGGEEGNEGLFFGDQIFPELAIPAALPDADESPAEEVAVAEPPSEPSTTPAAEASATEDPEVVRVAKQTPNLAAATKPAGSPVQASDSGGDTLTYFGAGMVLALLFLFALTFVVVKPQQP